MQVWSARKTYLIKASKSKRWSVDCEDRTNAYLLVSVTVTTATVPEPFVVVAAAAAAAATEVEEDELVGEEVETELDVLLSGRKNARHAP